METGVLGALDLAKVSDGVNPFGESRKSCRCFYIHSLGYVMYQVSYIRGICLVRNTGLNLMKVSHFAAERTTYETYFEREASIRKTLGMAPKNS